MYVYVCVCMCTYVYYINVCSVYPCMCRSVGVWYTSIHYIYTTLIGTHTKHIQRKFSRGHSQKSHKCRTPRWLYRCCIETTKRTPKQIEQVQFTIVLVCRTLLSIAVLGGANGCYKSQSTKNVHIRYAGAKKIGSKMPCSEDFGAPSRDKLTKRHQHPPTSHSLMAISLQILSVLPHISWFYPHSLLSYFSHPFVEKNLMLSSMRKNAPPKKKTWSICDRPQTKKTLFLLVMVIFHWNSKKNKIKLPIQFNRRPRRAKLLHCLCFGSGTPCSPPAQLSRWWATAEWGWRHCVGRHWESWSKGWSGAK